MPPPLVEQDLEMIFGVPFVNTQRGVGVGELDGTWMMLCAFEGEFEYQGGETEQEIFQQAADACVYLQSPPSLRFESTNWDLYFAGNPQREIRAVVVAGYVYRDILEYPSMYSGVDFISTAAGIVEYSTLHDPQMGLLDGATTAAMMLYSAHETIKPASDDARWLAQVLAPKRVGPEPLKPTGLETPAMSFAVESSDDALPIKNSAQLCFVQWRSCMDDEASEFRKDFTACKNDRVRDVSAFTVACLSLLTLGAPGVVGALACVITTYGVFCDPLFEKCVTSSLNSRRTGVSLCHATLAICCDRPGTECPEW